MKQLFRVSPEGVFASAKIIGALGKLQNEVHRLSFTRKADCGFVDAVDNFVRVHCSHFRKLATDSISYGRFFWKCSVTDPGAPKSPK